MIGNGSAMLVSTRIRHLRSSASFWFLSSSPGIHHVFCQEISSFIQVCPASYYCAYLLTRLFVFNCNIFMNQSRVCLSHAVFRRYIDVITTWAMPIWNFSLQLGFLLPSLGQASEITVYLTPKLPIVLHGHKNGNLHLSIFLFIFLLIIFL